MEMVEKVQACDVEEILALQKTAFREEAELYNDFSISPMTQTLDEIRREFREKTFLKIVEAGRIVGSVRGDCDAAGVCSIGRLVVHPDCRNRGLGRRLMGAIEACFPDARKYRLFTGNKSVRNIALYEKLGYRRVESPVSAAGTGLVFLEKSHLDS
ncbi:MAG TPA: GNAT family N-acetyltransferase [Candidatus Sumerlaeota bacterium]|nr:GNAT family N-acetyltransferase [Candidatus Sumerlaeota bacterium]